MFSNYAAGIPSNPAILSSPLTVYNVLLIALFLCIEHSYILSFNLIVQPLNPNAAAAADGPSYFCF
jgi:hypothetical protein